MADIYHNQNADAAIIEDGETTSSAVAIGDFSRGSFSTDDALDGTAFTLQVSNDKVQWDSVRNDAGSALSNITVTTEKNYKLPAQVFSYRWLRVVSGSAQSGADSTIAFFLATMAAS